MQRPTNEELNDNYGILIDIDTGEGVRLATSDEREESIEAMEHDGGEGIICVDGRNCCVRD